MSLRGALMVAGTERSKLGAQLKVRLVFLACVVSPFAFATAMRVQSTVPEDTLFGRSVRESGFAVPLVILGFAALWALPLLSSIVGGDVFSAEDRYGTWTTVLTRSRGRSELFIGKVVAALCFALAAIAALAVSSVAAGLFVIGRQPLVDLSGILLPPTPALLRIALAWMSVLPPAFAFTGIGVLVSVCTRSSAAGIGVPVLAALTMQLYAFVDGPEAVRRLVLASGFGAWHGLFTEPPFYGPMIHATVVSGLYLVACLAIAYRVLQRRDIG